MITTGIILLARETGYEAIKRSQWVMSDHLVNNAKKDLSNDGPFSNCDNDGQLTIGRQIAGEVPSPALGGHPRVRDNEIFKECLSDQRRHATATKVAEGCT